MVLRIWTEGDLETIAEIEKRCFPEDAWTKEMLADGLRSPYGWSVLAEEGGQVCGYACLFSLFETAELMNIAVDIPFRRRGVGERLITALHEKAKEMGAERVMLEVRASNAAAIALYKKYGYEKISVRKGYYSGGEDADIMQKIL
jgi:ribosomal-protein-alanine N-acetyltransferase